MIVHQVLSGAGPRDAITTEARAFRARFTGWGWTGADYAARRAPGAETAFRPLAELAPGPTDVVLVHHSAALPGLEGLLALPGRRMLLHHNVTPSRWLWDVSPYVAALCALGREQLPQLVAGCHLAAADSAFNAAELAAVGATRAEVLPLLVDLAPLGDPASPRRPAGAPHVLFVGRLSPHKRQDRVIEAFAHFRRVHAPAAHLTLVGEPLTEGFAAQLRALGAQQAPGAVAVRSGLTEAELGEVYRSADVFLCLSEHEGFCVPLLEAMALGVPVIARAAGAVAEVAGDAAVILNEDDPALVSELLHLVVADPDLRDELIRRGRARAAAFEPGRVATRLQQLVVATARGG
ncbi:MAG TPA: glycosyltransferase family 4 protein [Solirubrobacteraceae bacterium]|nr:glycosyltransferase family 4 protein [Solirubrobacteraceae bacterium]